MKDVKDFTWPVSSFSKDEYDFFQKEIGIRKGYMKDKQIYIFGAGIRGCLFLKFFEMSETKIGGFIDNNKEKLKGHIEHYSISSLEEITSCHDKDYYIVISVENGEGIVDQLEKAGLKRDEDFCHIGSYLYDKFENRFFSKFQPDLLVMGDCILTQVAFGDVSYQTLSDLIADRIKNVKLLGMHGMPMATFYHMFRLQIKLGMAPSRLLLFVNMVMFDGKKDILPRAQHPVLLKRIQAKLPFEDIEFEDYVRKASDRFQQFNTDIFVKGRKQSIHHRNEQIQRLHFQMNYLYQLDEQNESLIYLKKIAQLAEEKGVSLLLYIAPINFERGEELVGDNIKTKHQEHMSVIKRFLKPHQYEICDAGFELGKKDFATQDTTNEITNWNGRLKEVEILLNCEKKNDI